MRRNKYIIASLLLTIIGIGPAFASSNNDMGGAIRPGHVILLTNDGYVPDLLSLLPDISFADLKSYAGWKITGLADVTGLKRPATKDSEPSLIDNLYVMSFPDTVDVIEVLSRIKDNPGLKVAEPDFRLELYSWPTDSLFFSQWYLHNTGQEYYAVERFPDDSNDVLIMARGMPGEDINIGPVYDNAPADTVTVLVGVIDSGTDYIHPDLADNHFVNPGEIPGNGIDDDHNGLVDDYRGWDFSGDTINVFDIVGDNDATDSMGHGTHVAGLIAAVSNEIGIAGYPAKIKILPVKIFPNGFLSVSLAALIYAADMGAKILNMSWGFPYDAQSLQETLKYAVKRGCIPVAAAGNSGTSDPTYPAWYPESFTVGGTGSDGYMAYFSTYGAFLDIVAPARDILSLRATGTDLYATANPKEPNVHIINDLYLVADGTSMAAPLVSGAAAMLLSYNPGLESETIRNILRQSADDLLDPYDEGEYLPGYDTLSGWGRLNVGRAFEMAQAPAVYLAAPADNDILSGEVVIGIATTGGYSGPADLYFAEGKGDKSWTLLYHTDQVVAGDTFYVWDSNFLSGYVSLRLESSNGADEINLRIVNDDLVNIGLPADDAEVKYLVDVYGSAYGIGYDSTVISSRPETSSLYNRLAKSTDMFFDERIYEWPIFNLAHGYHYLRIQVYIGDKILADSVRVKALSAMRAGFPVYMPGYVGISPGVADIDGDGRKEIAIGSRNGLYVYKNDGTLMENFPVQPDRDMRSVPAFDDIDGDGLLDIIVTGEEMVACYNYLGQPLPGWPRAAATGETFSIFPTPMLTELYDNADSVIIYMNKYGEIHAYEYSGDPYFYSLGGLFTSLDPNINDTNLATGLHLPFATAVDLDDNGVTEIISLYSASIRNSGVYLWNGRNGLPAFDWETPLARKIRQSFGGLLADVDDDASLEIVVSGMDTTYETTIWVTKNGEDDIAGWPVKLPELVNWIGTVPVCADIDGNGSKEIVAAFFGYDVGRIYVFNHDGTSYVDNPAFPPGMLLTVPVTFGNVIVADIDGNGIANIICRSGYVFPGTGYERIFAWEPNGDLTPGFPIATPTPINEVTSTPFTPIVDDLDGDGMAEMIMSGDYKNLFVWDLGAPYDSSVMVWPKFLYDMKNSGINPHRADPTDVDDYTAIVPGRFEILGNYPNPFNPSTTIEYSLARAVDIRLEVFNILGQKVKTLVSGTQPAGLYKIVWDGTDNDGHEVATGVYLAWMRGGDKESTRKMMLLR